MSYLTDAIDEHVRTVASPPLAPFHPSPDQLRFLHLHLHAHHLVDRWRWLMQGSLLRAWAGGRTATLSRMEVDELVAAGLLFKGAGAADVHLTSQGRDAVVSLQQEERV